MAIIIEEQISDRVAVIRMPLNEDRYRTQFGVTLDGEVVLRSGAARREDWCEAHSFATGLALGLSKVSL